MDLEEQTYPGATPDLAEATANGVLSHVHKHSVYQADVLRNNAGYLLAAITQARQGAVAGQAGDGVREALTKLLAVMSSDGPTIQLVDAMREAEAALSATPAPACNPELDATDGACPCWWRGHDNGAKGMADKTEELRAKLLDAGVEQIEQAAELRALRAEREAWRIVAKGYLHRRDYGTLDTSEFADTFKSLLAQPEAPKVEPSPQEQADAAMAVARRDRGMVEPVPCGHMYCGRRCVLPAGHSGHHDTDPAPAVSKTETTGLLDTVHGYLERAWDESHKDDAVVAHLIEAVRTLAAANTGEAMKRAPLDPRTLRAVARRLHRAAILSGISEPASRELARWSDALAAEARRITRAQKQRKAKRR